jgi:hypothetical protein
MKRQFLPYFLIALAAELGTTLLQRFRTVSDGEPGLYYPDFQSLLLSRLVVWLLIFLLLSGVWLVVSRRGSTR